MSPSQQSWLPDLIYTNGTFQPGGLSSNEGRIAGPALGDQLQNSTRLKNRALLPGLVNAHSHAFQRVIRGRTEYRSQDSSDSFWTWRELMYSAAIRLSPEDVYDASRMAFLEMALSGITAVGEFHYLHHAPDGSPYDDPNLVAKEVVRAARDVGLRIALLRVAYARAGFETEPDPRQKRFIEASPDLYLSNFEKLRKDLDGDKFAWAAIAPHSVRAVPLAYLKEIVDYGNSLRLPIHMHVAEQPAEVSACITEHGRSPISLLQTEGLLSPRFTAVHAIHITEKAASALAESQAIVCACPTTERNLGDGVVRADLLFDHGIRVALGTDSQTQIDLLEDARELEYHLRLQKMERVVLANRNDEDRSSLARRLIDCATVAGAHSIGLAGGSLDDGSPTDFFTVDLDDPTIAGSQADDLISNIVFSSAKSAVQDVVVGGKAIVKDGKHADQEEIVERFGRLQKKLWNA